MTLVSALKKKTPPNHPLADYFIQYPLPTILNTVNRIDFQNTMSTEDSEL